MIKIRHLDELGRSIGSIESKWEDGFVNTFGLYTFNSILASRGAGKTTNITQVFRKYKGRFLIFVPSEYVLRQYEESMKDHLADMTSRFSPPGWKKTLDQESFKLIYEFKDGLFDRAEVEIINLRKSKEVEIRPDHHVIVDDPEAADNEVIDLMRKLKNFKTFTMVGSIMRDGWTAAKEFHEFCKDQSSEKKRKERNAKKFIHRKIPADKYKNDEYYEREVLCRYASKKERSL